MKRLPRFAVNLTLSAVVSVLFLGALEGLARVFEPPRPAGAPARDYFPDWGRWEGDFYRFGAGPPTWPPAPNTNGDGLRDRHHTIEPPPGVRRVVCLGDSVTYGYELKRDEAWPQRLEALLAERGGRVEVFNAAAPGWSTRQQRIAWRELMRKYRPQRVLIGVCLNDIPELQNNLARTPPWLARLYQRSALVRRAVGAEAREIDSVRGMFLRPGAPAVRAGFERFFAELRGLRDDVRAEGAELALLVFPFRFQYEPGAPAPSVQQRLGEFAAAEGLAFVDLLPALQPLGAAGFKDYCHLTPAATQAVAARLADDPALDAPRPYAAVLRAHGVATADAAALARALRAGGAELRAAAAWALAAAPPAPVPRALVERLVATLDDADAEVRLQATRALGRAASGDAARAAAAALLPRLDDPAEPQRLAAAEALWALPAAAADTGGLGARLGHADPHVGAFAEEALVRLGKPALAALRHELGGTAPAARRRAARALGRLGGAARPAVPALERLLEDPDRGVRRQAARALERLRGTPAADTP